MLTTKDKINLVDCNTYIRKSLPQILSSSECGITMRALVQLIFSLPPRIRLYIRHVNLNVHKNLLDVLRSFVLTLSDCLGLEK